MLNRIVLMGRLTETPELKFTQSKVPVTNFTVAVERDASFRDGGRETDFINCTAWNKTAEFVSNYFEKGKMIAVEGKMQATKWKDKEGNNRVNWSVFVDQVHFCGGKKEDEDPAIARRKRNEAAGDGDFDSLEDVNDDNKVPF